MLCLLIELCLLSLTGLLMIHLVGGGKRSKSIPTCQHCGISGYTRPNCFQIRSQKPWVKKQVTRNNEPGIRNQINNLCDQVKLISEKL
jgi:hypothetical protein